MYIYMYIYIIIYIYIYIYIYISSDKSSKIQSQRYLYDLTTFRMLFPIYNLTGL